MSEQARRSDRGARERELQRANDYYRVLLAIAGHDLRQPLQAIMSAHESLERRLDSGSEQEYLRRGMFAIRRLSEQLDLLIDALRLHEHSLNIQAAPVALSPIFARICRDNEELANRKGLTLRAHPTRAAVLSDAVLLESILRNLIRNALEYTGLGGRILVGCRRRGGLLKIEVHDTGIGIAVDELSQVFEAFHRVDSTRADGLGLGLFVVRRAVDLLGHRMEVRSTVGSGSCFSVLAPATDAAYVGVRTELLTSEGALADNGLSAAKRTSRPHLFATAHESFCARES